MKNYLMKLVETPILKDSVKEYQDVHKHFTRYSKGLFDGPIIKVSQTKGKITVWCSYEYEDLVLRLAIDSCSDEEFSIKGAVMGSVDFNPLLKKFGLGGKEWIPEKSKGQAINYTTTFKTATTVSREKLNLLATEGTPYIYCLLSFVSKDKETDLKTKTKPPRPSSKNPEDSSATSKLKFCTLKIANTPEMQQRIIDDIAFDFKDEIPKKWKSITISNNYEITDLIFPKKEENLSSRAFRLNTIRKGTLNRTAEVDNETFTNSIEFQA